MKFISKRLKINSFNQELEKMRQDTGYYQYLHMSKQYKSYLKRAERKNIEFNIPEEEFNKLLGGNCAYCGKEKANGIDRVDSNLGYNLANSVSCCTMCNMMKYKYTKEEFINHVSKIYQYNAINNNTSS